VASIGDSNEDKVPDLLIGAPLGLVKGIKAGYVLGISGNKGAELFVSQGSLVGEWEGSALTGVGDWNKDGVMDYAIGTSGLNKESGLVTVHAGTPRPSLQSSPASVSLLRGGKVTFELHAPQKHGNKLYILLGSISGTTPGLKLGGLTLPLNVDPWFWYTAASPNGLIQSSLAFLAADGSGSASLTIPPLSPLSMSGIKMQHAYLVFSLIPIYSVDFASNPTETTLTK